jgi:hypothetical protein
MSKHPASWPPTAWDPRPRAILDELVRGRGLDRYAYFHVAGEGRFFPDGTEDVSGYVVDDRGREFFFWTGWEPERGAVTFRTWEEVKPRADHRPGAEERRARAAVGLAD